MGDPVDHKAQDIYSLAPLIKSLLMSALKRRKLSDSCCSEERLARKEKLWNSILLKWKTLGKLLCVHIGAKHCVCL